MDKRTTNSTCCIVGARRSLHASWSVSVPLGKVLPLLLMKTSMWRHRTVGWGVRTALPHSQMGPCPVPTPGCQEAPSKAKFTRDAFSAWEVFFRVYSSHGKVAPCQFLLLSFPARGTVIKIYPFAHGRSVPASARLELILPCPKARRSCGHLKKKSELASDPEERRVCALQE